MHDHGSRPRASLLALARAKAGFILIEFALVGGFLLTLLMAFIDLGLLFFNDVNLHNATRTVARELRILAGRTQLEQATAIDQALCGQLILIDCADVEIDVRSYADLASVATTSQVDGTGHLVNPQIDTINGDELIFVTTLYRHRMMTPAGLLLRTASLPNASGAARLVMATVFTRAEPI